MKQTARPNFPILFSISTCHMLNDMIQSLILAIYPLLKSSFSLSFAQIGLITLVYQMSASILQPIVGHYTDKHPKPFSLVIGMGSTLSGLLLLSVAPHYSIVLVAAALVGTGSSIFHPESSRVARLASGGRHGLAQSIFQVGGNFGSSIGPLLAAYIILPHGQRSVAWFSLAALLAMLILTRIGIWYGQNLKTRKPKTENDTALPLPLRQVVMAVTILMVLVFSKYFYLASISSYYLFYLVHKFSVTEQQAQIRLFIFLAAVAAGTVIGGPIGDRFGRKYVIWGSILGVLPFTLALPHASLFWTGMLTVPIGVILASAFSAILVYATELIPGRTGMVSGLFFGLAFGMGGIGAAVLGMIADWKGIDFVYQICAFLPAIGLLATFLPDMRKVETAKTSEHDAGPLQSILSKSN
jgi:FSR family fosmidomycin resistance protein-like MFS transporter